MRRAGAPKLCCVSRQTQKQVDSLLPFSIAVAMFTEHYPTVGDPTVLGAIFEPTVADCERVAWLCLEFDVVH